MLQGGLHSQSCRVISPSAGSVSSRVGGVRGCEGETAIADSLTFPLKFYSIFTDVENTIFLQVSLSQGSTRSLLSICPSYLLRIVHSNIPEIARFHTMRNQLRSEKTFLRFLEEQLAKRLPPDWAFRLEEQAASGDRRADATFTLRSPDGRFGIVAVEFKTAIEPRMLPAIKEQTGRISCETVLVGAPFLSPRTRELLSDANLSYADLTGNLRLATAQPAVFIEAQGETKNPWREPRPLMSLKGRAVARVIRTLCDFRPPYSTSDLAEKSGASLATASRVVSLLVSEALVTREGRGPVTDVAWSELIRRWAEDYSLLETNMARGFIEPRGLDSLRKKLSTTRTKYAVTGSLAAQIPTSVAPPRLATVYADDPAGLAELLDLRPSQAGANVILLEPFDSVVFQRSSTRDGLTCAAFSQVAVDLLTSPGRGPAEGVELIRWMEENEGEWRS